MTWWIDVKHNIQLCKCLGAGRQRVLDLKQYERRIAHQFRSHNEEERITMSLKGIVPQDKRVSLIRFVSNYKFHRTLPIFLARRRNVLCDKSCC